MGVRRKSGVFRRRVLELRAADRRVASAELREERVKESFPSLSFGPRTCREWRASPEVAF